MNKKTRRKEILDKLKNSNRIFEEDYNFLEKDLEIELENKFIKKKEKLSSLLFEKELLQAIISDLNY